MLFMPSLSKVYEYRTLQDAQESTLLKAGNVACMYLAYHALKSLVTCDCYCRFHPS